MRLLQHVTEANCECGADVGQLGRHRVECPTAHLGFGTWLPFFLVTMLESMKHVLPKKKLLSSSIFGHQHDARERP